MTWVEVCLENAVPDEQLRADIKNDILEHHRAVSVRIASHLQLTMENVARFGWLLGGMLNKNAVQAQEPARLAQRHLLTKSTSSPLAAAIAANDVLMQELERFCTAVPPVMLWRGQGS